MIIYKITNKINDKIYIGQTIRSLEERVKEHKRKKNCSLYKAFNKYGIENFDFEIIEKCNSTEEMNEKEIYWIKYYDCLMPKGYNLCEGGGQTNGYTHKEESKIKMSKNEEMNEKEIYWIKYYDCLMPKGYNLCEGGGQTNGYTHKEESKIKMSKNRGRYYGENNPFYGKTHTLEQKQKWSKERKGKDLSKAIENSIKSRQRKVINLDTMEIFNSIKEASEKYNLKDTHITRVCKGKRNKTGGYRWQYLEEYMAIPCQASEN